MTYDTSETLTRVRRAPSSENFLATGTFSTETCFGVGIGVCGRASAGVSVDGVGISTSCCLSVWDSNNEMNS